jgi:hypothetical protein
MEKRKNRKRKRKKEILKILGEKRKKRLSVKMTARERKRGKR